MSAQIIRMPAPAKRSAPGRKELGWLKTEAMLYCRAERAREEKMAAVKELMALATPVTPDPTGEILKLLRRIDRRLSRIT